MEEVKDIKLTQYSHGAGCGCKISPQVLDTILDSAQVIPDFPGLLVGNDARDDAAVFALGDGTAVVSTTDFFMPIVDDPFDFGRIAAVNAISDVYAMGGTPLMAIAILGWPVNVLPPEVARKVLEGGRAACAEAGIPLAGGHSIDSPEPIFGLAVSGRVNLDHLKRNDGATAGCSLFLTKPLGVGILSTAQKKGKLRPEHRYTGRDHMVRLNDAGAVFAQQPYIKAMTDVTGFGLLGHLSEMCEGSGVSAVIHLDRVPQIPVIGPYIAANCIPGGTKRNWSSYGHKIGPISEDAKNILCDPQTSGGLLVAVESVAEEAFIRLAKELGMDLTSFGKLTDRTQPLVRVVEG